jgi:branched-chain amino acid transport system ATP-binding protein
VLKVENLNAGYGKLQVLHEVSLFFPERKISVVIGPNGSGKSTLLKTIFGLTKIYSGRIIFENNDITFLPPHKIASMGIAYLPQTNNVFENLTVEENLRMAGYNLSKEELEARVASSLEFFPQLKLYMKRKAKQLSGGERQMLAIAMSLIRKPRLMMFDEPTAALAPKIAHQVLRSIVKLRDELGITIILVEQNAKAALEIADKASLLVSGRVIFDGLPKDLLENPELGRMYLGVTSSQV